MIFLYRNKNIKWNFTFQNKIKIKNKKSTSKVTRGTAQLKEHKKCKKSEKMKFSIGSRCVYLNFFFNFKKNQFLILINNLFHKTSNYFSLDTFFFFSGR